MGATKQIFRGRACSLHIRVERKDDKTLSVYESEVYGAHYTLLARRPVAEIVGHFDVSSGLRRWLE